MSRIDVRGGSTQIRRVLAHARDEAKRAKVGALIFIGDAIKENPDTLASFERLRAAWGEGVHVPGGAGPRGYSARSAKSPA